MYCYPIISCQKKMLPYNWFVRDSKISWERRKKKTQFYTVKETPIWQEMNARSVWKIMTRKNTIGALWLFVAIRIVNDVSKRSSRRIQQKIWSVQCAMRNLTNQMFSNFFKFLINAYKTGGSRHYFYWSNFWNFISVLKSLETGETFIWPKFGHIIYDSYFNPFAQKWIWTEKLAKNHRFS